MNRLSIVAGLRIVGVSVLDWLFSTQPLQVVCGPACCGICPVLKVRTTEYVAGSITETLAERSSGHYEMACRCGDGPHSISAGGRIDVRRGGGIHCTALCARSAVVR